MNYDDILNKEIDIYKNNINIHQLPDSHHYIANDYLLPILKKRCGINSYNELVIREIIKKFKQKNEPLNILSLGSGNCDFESSIAVETQAEISFDLIEINPYMIERGKKHFSKFDSYKIIANFIQADVNKLQLDKQYDFILANHSLHHFIELEHIFKQISNSLKSDGQFLVNDMIGRNGHDFYPNALEYTNMIWQLLPTKYQYSSAQKKLFTKRTHWSSHIDGKDPLEGIRAQDILPLLLKNFKPEILGTFFGFINRFIDRDFGHNFNPVEPFAKSILDFAWNIDNNLLKTQKLRPTQIVASLRKKSFSEKIDLKYTYIKNINEYNKIPTELEYSPKTGF